MNVAFVCVRNAGRSQMATAFAERERERRGLEREVGIRTGGTEPADDVHDEVVTVMRSAGIDLSGRTPREITVEELRNTDLVITMGCSATDVCPATWGGDATDWGIDDPQGRSVEAVRDIRETIRARVSDLFDEIEAGRESTD